MIVQLEKNISPALEEEILQKINLLEYSTTKVVTQFQEYIIGIGKKEIDIRSIGNMDGVVDVHRVDDAYKLVSKQWKVDNTIIDLGDGVRVESGELAIIAGPCSIESEEHAIETMEHLTNNKVHVMRTMVFKPRSSPYSFRGIGIEGLKNVYGECKKHGMKIISEVMQVSQVEEMLDYVDIFQVGARNTQNFSLLDALGKVDKPVMIKRGMSGTIDELLQSAEYIFSNGNEKIILCERGIRTYENAYRNTFDLNAIPILKEKSHLPVIADPSHSVGIRMYVEQMALAAVMAGADGITVEVHSSPERAFSDGQQTLNYNEAERLYKNLRIVNCTRKSLIK